MTTYFPTVDDALTSRVAAPIAQSPVGTETILIVEDEPGLRQLMKGRSNDTATACCAPKTAPTRSRLPGRHDGTLHLLLSDVILPDLSGADLAHWIVHLRPAIKVLYVSGFTNLSLDAGSTSPRTGFLAKPFMPHALAAKVRECLDSTQTVNSPNPAK